MASVESDIFEIIAEKAAVERESGQRRKLEELEIESLDVVEIIFAVEEKFDIHVPFNANDQELEFETVGDVVEAVEAFIEETAALQIETALGFPANIRKDSLMKELSLPVSVSFPRPGTMLRIFGIGSVKASHRLVRLRQYRQIH